MYIIDAFVDYKKILPKYRNIEYIVSELEKKSIIHSDNFRAINDIIRGIYKGMVRKADFEKLIEYINELSKDIYKIKKSKEE